MPSIEFLWQTIGSTLLSLTCIWALWRGEAPERWGAGILLIGWLATSLVQSGPGAGLGYFLVDAAAMVAFVMLSLWSRRIWTIFIAAFQLNSVVSHLVSKLSSHVDMYTLITALGLWGGYGLTFALMGGMWALELRRRRESIA